MIIWLASYPKSGNTWLRALLSTYFFAQQKDKLNFDILKEIPNFVQSRFFSKIVDLNKLKNEPLEICNYWNAAQTRINLSNETKFFKTHNACVSVKEKWFTTKENSIGYIYIVRDPRSVVCSMASHSNIKIENSVEDLLNKNFIGYNGEYSLAELTCSWKINYLSWKKKKNFPGIIIKYEDFKDNPYNEFEKILLFLKDKINFKFDKVSVQKTLDTCSFTNLKNLENDKGFVEAKNGKFFRKGLKDSWKTELPSSLQKKIENNLGEEMRELGYI
tara:strand:- start:358 stop:1179 length:822 start_codon:yes stop_codon:yes gene_type:complete